MENSAKKKSNKAGKAAKSKTPNNSPKKEVAMEETMVQKFERKMKNIKKSLEDDKDRFRTDNVFILAIHKLIEYQFEVSQMQIANKSCDLLIAVQRMLEELKDKHPCDAKIYEDSICDVEEIIGRLDELVFFNYGYKGELLVAA
jgi:hypothetical protein